MAGSLLPAGSFSQISYWNSYVSAPAVTERGFCQRMNVTVKIPWDLYYDKSVDVKFYSRVSDSSNYYEEETHNLPEGDYVQADYNIVFTSTNWRKQVVFLRPEPLGNNEYRLDLSALSPTGTSYYLFALSDTDLKTSTSIPLVRDELLEDSSRFLGSKYYSESGDTGNDISVLVDLWE